jgi:hypothetical protein
LGLFGGILQGLGGIVGMDLGAKQNAHSIAHATNQQIGGINKAIDEQNAQMGQNRTDYGPYTGFGSAAIGPLGDLLGLNGPDAAAKAMAALKSSPVFTSLFNTGQEAVLQNASATGGVRGGNVQTALAENGENTFAKVIQDQIERLMGGAQLGAQATDNLVNVNQQGANNISSGYTSIGNAQSNKTLGQQQVWNNLGSQIQQMIAQFAGAGGF